LSFIATPATTLEMHRIGTVDPCHWDCATIAIRCSIEIISDRPFHSFDLAADFASVFIFRHVHRSDP